MWEKPSKAKLENGARAVWAQCALGVFAVNLGSGYDGQAAD
jgi:hypothetical protein